MRHGGFLQGTGCYCRAGWICARQGGFLQGTVGFYGAGRVPLAPERVRRGGSNRGVRRAGEESAQTSYLGSWEGEGECHGEGGSSIARRVHRRSAECLERVPFREGGCHFGEAGVSERVPIWRGGCCKMVAAEEKEGCSLPMHPPHHMPLQR